MSLSRIQEYNPNLPNLGPGTGIDTKPDERISALCFDRTMKEQFHEFTVTEDRPGEKLVFSVLV